MVCLFAPCLHVHQQHVFLSGRYDLLSVVPVRYLFRCNVSISMLSVPVRCLWLHAAYLHDIYLCAVCFPVI
jgi:hypothetical protein